MKRLIIVLALMAFGSVLAMAQNPGPCESVTNSATTGQTIRANSAGSAPPCSWTTPATGSGNSTICIATASATVPTCPGSPVPTSLTGLTGTLVIQTQTSGAPTTLNIASLGAKNIYVNGAVSSVSNILAVGTYQFYYDGTQIQVTVPGGSVFTGSTAVTQAFSATPTFSLADVSVKSPVRIEAGAMTANVTAVTFTNKTAGAKFSIVWLQDGTGGRTLTHGASATGTCELAIASAANATTEQFYEVSADGSTVTGAGCQSTSQSYSNFPLTTVPPTPVAGIISCGGVTANNNYQCTAPGAIGIGMVQPKTATTNQFVTAIAADGTVSQATYSNPGMVGYAVSDLTGQTAALTTTALATPASTGAYRVSYYAKVTTAGTTSILGGTTGFVLNYTDGTDSVAQNLTLTEANQSGTILSIGTGNVTNTTAAVIYGSAVVYAKTGVAMTYNLGYTSTGTAMQYEIHVRLEAL